MQTQNANTITNELAEVFGEPIYTYTRAQAIEDGMLIDFTDPASDTGEVCREHYKFPVAATSAVFEIMRKAVENPRYCNDYKGVLHDMLWMSRCNKRQIDASTVLFQVIIQGAGRQKIYTFKLVCGPGDQGEPVITIMLPND